VDPVTLLRACRLADADMRMIEARRALRRFGTGCLHMAAGMAEMGIGAHQAKEAMTDLWATLWAGREWDRA
jgi:hypothetical protein